MSVGHPVFTMMNRLDTENIVTSEVLTEDLYRHLSNKTVKHGSFSNERASCLIR